MMPSDKIYNKFVFVMPIITDFIYAALIQLTINPLARERY